MSLTAIGRPFQLLAVAAVVLVVGTEAETSSARAQSLREVLERAAEYSAAYGDVLASVLADELFEQPLVLRQEGEVIERRQLESEIAFVKLAGGLDWLAFRSVLRVDGTVVADAAGRLERVVSHDVAVGVHTSESDRHRQRTLQSGPRPAQFQRANHRAAVPLAAASKSIPLSKELRGAGRSGGYLGRGLPRTEPRNIHSYAGRP